MGIKVLLETLVTLQLLSFHEICLFNEKYQAYLNINNDRIQKDIILIFLVNFSY